jgi:hypothetical protein
VALAVGAAALTGRLPIRAFTTLVLVRVPDRVGAVGGPRSIQDILDHADELAARFETNEPEPSDERPVEEYLLERAALAPGGSERQIVDAITAARTKGVSWTRIGELLGTSAQAAQQRYGNVITTS